eukprot:gene3812-4742_t
MNAFQYLDVMRRWKNFSKKHAKKIYELDLGAAEIAPEPYKQRSILGIPTIIYETLVPGRFTPMTSPHLGVLFRTNNETDFYDERYFTVKYNYVTITEQDAKPRVKELLPNIKCAFDQNPNPLLPEIKKGYYTQNALCPNQSVLLTGSYEMNQYRYLDVEINRCKCPGSAVNCSNCASEEEFSKLFFEGSIVVLLVESLPSYQPMVKYRTIFPDIPDMAAPPVNRKYTQTILWKTLRTFFNRVDIYIRKKSTLNGPRFVFDSHFNEFYSMGTVEARPDDYTDNYAVLFKAYFRIDPFESEEIRQSPQILQLVGSWGALLAWKESTETQYVDFFWPIIHLEFNSRGFRFGIRPIFWVISTDTTFKLSIFGVINIFSKDRGDDTWIVLFPFFWYRYKNGRLFWTIPPLLWVRSNDTKDTLKIVVPLAFVYSSGPDGFYLNLALIFQISKLKNLFVLFLFPLFIYRRKGDSFVLNILICFNYRRYSNGSFNWFFFFVVCFGDGTGAEFNSAVKIVNALLFYTHIHKIHSQIKWNIFFPLLWIRVKEGSSFLFHLWPAFGFKISQKGRGFSIFLLYPAIIYRNREHGRLVQFYFLFPFVHYYHDKDNKECRHGIIPVYFYSNRPKISKGHILLYFWYCEKARNKIKMHDMVEISSPNNNGLQDIPSNENIGNITVNDNNGDIPAMDVPLPPPPPPPPVVVAQVAVETDYGTEKYDSTLRGFLPIIFFSSKSDERVLVFLPLFFTKWNVSCTNSYFVSLLFYQKLHHSDVKRWIIPIFYQKQTEDKTLILSPIYHYYRNKDNHARIILPVFIDFVKGESHLMVLLFPTFIYYRKSIFKFTCLFPFFFRTQDASKYEIFTYYFPFYGKSSTGSDSNNHYFLFPLFGLKKRIENNLLSIDILFPLFHYEKSDINFSLRLLPFFWKSTNSYNEFLLVMPFYWRFVTNKDSRAQSNTLLFPFYFKRDSAQYEFVFASPALLPPYYIHYHREASQVEQTYVFPFFAHKIKGLDHLRWFLLILYRHTWRDFSDHMYMNVLLYFRYNSEKLSLTGLAPFWVSWFRKDSCKRHIRILILLAYDKMINEEREQKKFAFLWFVSNQVSIFSREITKIKKPDQEPLEKRKVFLWPLFHHKSKSNGDYHLGILWLFRHSLSFIYLFKDGENSLFWIFLILYKSSTTILSRLAIIWLFHPIASFFLTESSPFSIIVRIFPLFWFMRSTTGKSSSIEDIRISRVGNIQEEQEGFSSLDQSTTTTNSGNNSSLIKTRILSIFYLVPGYGLINSSYENQVSTTYFLPIFYHKSGEKRKVFSFLWIGHPLVSFFNYDRKYNTIVHRIFPLYYRKLEKDNNLPLSIFSMFWIGHPTVSLFRYYKSVRSSIICFFPLFWRKISFAKESYHISIIYIVRKYGFFDYYKCDTDNSYHFYILFIYYILRRDNTTYLALLYLVHSRLAFITGRFKEASSKFFIFLFFYFKSSEKSHSTNVSFLWIVDPRVSFIGYWSRNQYSHFHILLLFWWSRIEQYSQVGFCWIACKKESQYGNQMINHEVPQSEQTHVIYSPISLYLYYNDGQFKTIHLMPFFRYTRNSTTERFWALLGLIYLCTKGDTTDFRWCYRWVRVKSGGSNLIVEVQPFVSYKKKAGQSKTLLMGGICGCYPSMCRVCCIEC